MLVHPIIDKLSALRFTGMVHALQEQMQMPDIDRLSFEERLGLLVDREMTERQDRSFKTRLKKAGLRQSACIEDVDFRHRRGLEKPKVPGHDEDHRVHSTKTGYRKNIAPSKDVGYPQPRPAAAQLTLYIRIDL